MLPRILCSSLIAAMFAVPCGADDFNYLIGRGKADITGPAAGVQMWGFVREDQVDEGIHFRLKSRAFVIVHPESEKRVALVTADLGSITHAIQREVVDRLQEDLGDAYTLENVLLTATHTHAGPAGYWIQGAGGPLGGGFYNEHFEAIVDGIVESITEAHEGLEPGNILIDTGEVHEAGANRSMAAYDNNPEEERAKYGAPTDTTMTLLKFVNAGGAAGVLTWFPSHPTAMTYYNKLISGDHKGRASSLMEEPRDEGFVAAFANSNCGDVTPNLNLDNTGPGEDDFETTHIIAQRQVDTAEKLVESASKALEGPIDYRQTYVDFSNLTVSGEFTGEGEQHTCASAYGYAFAAGSTEDGGGHPMFREGMTKQMVMIDNLVQEQFDVPPPSDELRQCHLPKAILFAPGDTNPPQQAQVRPLSLVRIGQLVLVCVPAEITTMSGRRVRETVRGVLGDTAEHMVVAAYTNDYAGYITTKEEYDTQQYEGGHTLYGPWTLAGYQQEYARLAKAMKAGEPAESHSPQRDPRGTVESTTLGTDFDAVPTGAEFGDVIQDANAEYGRGESVEVSFWSGHPQNGYERDHHFVAIQRKSEDDWTTIANDHNWETKFRWQPHAELEGASRATITWEIPRDVQAGMYRVVHFGNRKNKSGSVEKFSGESAVFSIE